MKGGSTYGRYNVYWRRMVMQYDRAQIASINHIRSHRTKDNKDISNNRVTVPEKETFKHVFKKAKDGNEMAAVLLDEWQKNCIPHNDKEEQVISLINKAVQDIFK